MSTSDRRPTERGAFIDGAVERDQRDDALTITNPAPAPASGA